MYNDDEGYSFGSQIRNPHQRRHHDQKNKFITQIRSATSGVRLSRDMEPDPAMLEKYDNFYQTTKSLLVLFQIMGVMPIERSELGKTTYR